MALASDIGVIVPTNFGDGVIVDLVGIESLLGGLADFTLERSRTPTLLLTLGVALPLRRPNKLNPKTFSSDKVILIVRQQL